MSTPHDRRKIPTRAVPRAAPVLAVITELMQQAVAFETAADAVSAERLFRKIIKLDSANVVALYRLAELLKQRGDFKQASKYLHTVCELSPADPALHFELAAACCAAGAYKNAVSACGTALSLGHDPYQTHCLLAEIHERDDNPPAAIAAYQAAAILRPTVAAIHNNLGLLQRKIGNLMTALSCYDTALRLDPEHVAAWNNRGNVLKEMGCFEQAIASLSRALSLAATNLDTRFNLGLTHLRLGEAALAIAQFNAILVAHPAHQAASLQLCEALLTLGNFADAETAIDRILEDDPRCAHAWYLKTSLRRYTGTDTELVGRLTRLRNTGKFTREEQIYLDFALGKVHDDLAQYELAFSHYQRANRARRPNLTASSLRLDEQIRSMIELPAEFWSSRTTTTLKQRPQLLFVLGMPRSGTTLMERVLAAHSVVAGAGEVDFLGPAIARMQLRKHESAFAALSLAEFGSEDFEDLRAAYYARISRLAGDAQFVTDKTPGNFLYLGVIQRLFPDARIIHCHRHPLDVAVSIYFQLFDAVDYAYDFADIADQYQRYLELMAHWRRTLTIPILDVAYEEMIGERERTTMSLLEFCGLPWEKSCLSPHQSTQTITTMSRWQARQPVYNRSVGRWRHYEPHLGELMRRLAPIHSTQT